MLTVSSSEKRLLLVLGVGVFLLANGFGYVFVSGAMIRLRSEETKLKKELASLENAKSKAADADERRAWIDANLVAYPNEAVRDTYLVNLLNEDLTRGLDVTITKDAPLPTFQSEFFEKSRYRATVTGPWLDVKEFLWRLQKPEEFRFVPKVSMVPRKNELDDAEQLVEAAVELEKWWPLPDSVIETEAAPGENVEQPTPAPVESTAAENPAATPPADSVPPATDTPPPAAPDDTAPAASAPADASAPAPSDTSTESPKPNP
jgi:hypothetical protein